MTLSSRLFRGDPALEACLLENRAHVLQGAVGDHVGKIQTALDFLDHARVHQVELSAKKYGRSTANAVLAYKKKRKIINFAYQTQADDIVGKMTIASLDKEMVAFENGSLQQSSCGDPVGAASAGVGAAAAVSMGLQGRPTVAGPAAATKFPANLRVIWQPTAAAVKRAQNRHLIQIPAANELLEFFDMEITGPTSFPDAIVSNNDVVDIRFGSDILRVRKDAENQHPGFPNVLRVIVCPFSTSEFGLTEGGFGSGFAGLRAFPDFILINANRDNRGDRLTLLHEMIHAATGLDEKDHDLDSDSVFSTGSERSVLKRKHAEALSKAFFAAAK